MDIRKFIDEHGDRVYAFALICTKSADSAAEVFLYISGECEKYAEDVYFSEIAREAFKLCRKAKCADSAETLSQCGLSKKQENLLAEFFPLPQIVRAAIHLRYECDSELDEIAELTGEKPRYISEQLDNLGKEVRERLENSYKELCLRLSASDDLKIKAVNAAQNGIHREFEVIDDPAPLHTWTKRQKTAAVVFAVIATIAVLIVIPIVNKLVDDYLTGESYDEAPPDLIFSYDNENQSGISGEET